MPRINPDNIKLRCMPWKVSSTFLPLDSAIDRIERSGYIESAKGFPVYESAGDWYQLDESITGIVEFFQLLSSRKQIPIDVAGLATLASRLRAGMPLQIEDLTRARICIHNLKRFALNCLTAGETNQALRDVKIKWGMEDLIGVPT